MALTFKAFRNNFSRPNVDPKYISRVNLVNIGPVDQTIELTTDTDISTDNTKSKVYVRK